MSCDLINAVEHHLEQVEPELDVKIVSGGSALRAGSALVVSMLKRSRRHLRVRDELSYRTVVKTREPALAAGAIVGMIRGREREQEDGA